MASPGQISGGPSQNFVQQGSVDWVSLSKSTVTLSLEVFARLSKAGIEPITVGMGRAICKEIPMKAEAQKRLNDVLSRLKSFASYNKVIYFGFGVRHILHDLRDSEAGSACIALCACLMTNYDSWHAAQVLREICLFKGAPTEIVPSLYQWQSLLNTCAGVVGASCKFPHMVEVFARHLRLQKESPVSIHQPASPADLAGCLSTLLDVASGKIASVRFTGGQEGSVDCAWIAAVAEWLLCLNIEIYTTSPSNPQELICGYQSPYSKPGEAQVIITPGDLHVKSVAVKSTTYVLSSLCVKWSWDSGTFFMRHSPWSSILRDSFGSSAQVLIDFDFRVENAGDLANKSLAMPFAELLGQIGLYWDPCFNSTPDNTPGKFQESGEVFHTFVATRFPELGAVIDASRSTKLDPQVSEDQAWKTFETLISQSCRCVSCTKAMVFGAVRFDLCAVRVASVIVDILRTLYRTEIDEEVLPSPTGFLQLYRRSPSNGSNLFSKSKTVRRTFNHTNSAANFSPSLNEIISLFGGSPSSGGGLFGSESFQKSKDVAKSSQGLCTYYKILEELELPLTQADKVRVVHGCLWLHGQIYTTATEPVPSISSKTKLADVPALLTNDLPIRFTATESRTPKLLELNYQIQYSHNWINLSWSHVVQMVPSLRGARSGGCTHSGTQRHLSLSGKSNTAAKNVPPRQIDTHFNIQLRDHPSSASLKTHIQEGTWLFLLSYTSTNESPLFNSQPFSGSQPSFNFNSHSLFGNQPVPNNQRDKRGNSRVGFQIQPSCYAQLYAKASLLWELDSGGLFGFQDTRFGREYTGCCLLCAIRALELELSFSALNPQWRKLALGKPWGWGKLHLLGPPSYSANVELVPDEATAQVQQNSAPHPPRRKTNKKKRPFQSFVSDDSGSTFVLEEEGGKTVPTLDVDDDVVEMVMLQTSATREVAVTSLEENKGDAVLSVFNLLRSRLE